jgi:RNA polymerase primary sigma factor
MITPPLRATIRLDNPRATGVFVMPGRASAAGRRGVAESERPEMVGQRRLLRAAQRGDPGARERVVVAHLGLIRGLASRYRGFGLPVEDLVQEGAFGLLDAIDHYDRSRGVPFESYARLRVRRAIRNALTDQARLIRLPKQVVERRRAIDQAEARLTAEAAGRLPTPAQLAAATGLTVDAVLEARSAAVVATSLDEPVLADGSTLASAVADRSASDPEGEAVAHERSELLNTAVAQLPERQRRIVTAHWGLNGPARSVVDVAADLELSPRRTQTIGRDALYELRAALEPAEAMP